MTLSESDRELLLSASLDEALSPAEQTAVDRLLREDPAAAKQRDELAATMALLRKSFGEIKGAKLPAGFSDRVIDAAAEAARRESLSTAHPLVRMHDERTVSSHESIDATGSASHFPRRGRLLAAIATLAASGLFVWIAIRPGGPDPEGPPDRVGGEVAMTDRSEPLGKAEQESNGISERLPEAAIAGRDGRPDGEGMVAEKRPESAAADVTTEGSDATELAPEAAIARAEPRAMAPSERAGSPLAALLVVSVELTAEGRESLALQRALRVADIRIAPSGLVSDQVVDELRQAAVIGAAEQNSEATIYFVEARASKLDRFLTLLMADSSAFASFGFSIASHPPLLASLTDWEADDSVDTDERSDGGIARDLVLADGEPLRVDRGPGMVAVGRELGGLGLMAPQTGTSAGGDFPSQILLLVH